MSKRKLPAAELASRPGIPTGLSPKALERWNPGVRAAQENDNSIGILDVIGEDYWDEGVTAKRIAGALRRIGANDVTVTINSPGGDFFEGLAIYNLLREHPGRVNVRILGVAASAASVIAMAGDEVRIARAGLLMIHNTWVIAAGDRHALREVSDWLTPFDEMLADIYAARSGLPREQLGLMLDEEKWATGAEAIELGLADDFLAADSIQNDPQAAEKGRPLHALRELEALLQKAGASRSKKRELVAQVRGKPSAAQHGMPGAAVTREVESLLESLRAI